MFIPILIVVARISFSDTQISNFDSLIFQTCSIFQTSVEPKFRTNHNIVIVKFDIASIVMQEQITVLHTVGSKL